MRAPINRVGRYELKAVVARTALSTVYDGWDSGTARRVAIKTMPLSAADDEEALARFRRGAQAARLLNHPNICAVYDYGETAEFAYLVMEFIDGPALKELLDRNQHFSILEIGHVVGGILDALQYSHDRRVVHRDMKPANVMFTQNNVVKITDFGIARLEDSEATQAGMVIGTPAYMSPEQFLGERIDRRSDIYSTGVLLYHILTGERPYEGTLAVIMHQVLYGGAPSLPSRSSTAVTASLDQVVTRAMARKREDRFKSCAEFKAELLAAIGGESTGRGIPPAWGAEVASRPPAIPEQSPAPVRVEERGGRISLVSNRDSTLGATEADFHAWREPVLDHILELLSGDFRSGTNHSRARDRLVALSTLFAGSIPDVKERQFQIGYQIERLGGLVVAYRSGIDDMPILNAAVLEDLDRLRIALVMGIGKLERWLEFHNTVAADPLREGTASPGVVGAAIDAMAAGMEAEPKYFDPDLPRTFRFLAEGAKDPMGVTKTIVFGTVKSAENVLLFLGQRALGIGRNAADAVEQHLSKAVTISLIVALSGAALRISGALPKEWTWLKPLLAVLAKGGGG